MDENDVSIRLEREDVLEGATLVYGFPGPGLSCVMAVNHIIQEAGLPRVGGMVSPVMPQVAIVKEFTPLPPVRIHARDKLAVLVTEISPGAELNRALADGIMELVGSRGLSRVIALEALVDREGLTAGEGDGETGGRKGSEAGVYCVQVPDPGEGGPCAPNVERFREGMISGLSGLLLTGAMEGGLRISCLLTKVNPMYPDARGAQRLLEALQGMGLGVDLKPGKMSETAEEIEAKVKETVEQAREYLDAQGGGPGEGSGETPSYMYR